MTPKKPKSLEFSYVPFKKLINTKAWKLTSEFVRKQSKGKCYTCLIRVPYQKMHAGHLLEKWGNAAIYFDLDGIRGQCFRCNRLLHGNKDIFGQKLRKEIGEERVKNLYKKGQKPKQWTKDELEAIYNQLK